MISTNKSMKTDERVCKNVLTFCKTKSIMRTDGGVQMAKMGRPKVDKPASRQVTIRFKEEEYDILLEYAENHQMTISQLLRWATMQQIKTDQK